MHQVLFQVFNFPIRTYSVFLLAAFVVGMIVVRRLIKRRSLLDPQMVVDLAFWVIIGVIIGARLLFVAMHWSDFADRPLRALNVMEGGAVYYGGFILGLVFGFLFLLIRWKKKYPGIGFKAFIDKLFTVMDAVAPAVALGEGIGRIGCFFNGCCFGLPTDVCGITFPPDSYAAAHYGTNHSIWPSQLFQSGGGILLFGILILLLFITRLRKGQLFGLFLLGFGMLRFGVNYFRWYDPNTNDLWTNQSIALIIMAMGIGIFIISQLTQEKVPTIKWVRAERKKMEEAERKREEKEEKKKKKSKKRR